MAGDCCLQMQKALTLRVHKVEASLADCFLAAVVAFLTCSHKCARTVKYLH